MPSCAVAGVDVSFRTLEGGERGLLEDIVRVGVDG